MRGVGGDSRGRRSSQRRPSSDICAGAGDSGQGDPVLGGINGQARGEGVESAGGEGGSRSSPHKSSSHGFAFFFRHLALEALGSLYTIME